MPKSKLTLYMDEDITRLAHKTAKLTGKSVSVMVKEFFLQREKESQSKEISPFVSRWIGMLRTKKSYKALRDEHIASRLKKYEDTD
ncbi:MAG: hypothetical protein HZA10_00205 [Nitrospirae bacterium]|nr:hypothetical protein [Nitrospirota bacterium]